jgi:replicative DNA helicase
MADNTDISLQKLPPHNIEAERFVLGAILLENEALPKSLSILRPADFYQTAHVKIFTCMAELFDKNEVIDLITLSQELQRREELENIGGEAYLMALLESIPTAANVSTHAKIVKEKALLRRMINVASQISTESYEDREEADRLLDRAQQLLFEVAEQRVGPGFSSMKDLIKDTFKSVEELYEHKKPIVGLSTGFSRFDELTSGFHKSDLIIIAARPSMGKTSLALNIAAHIAIKEHIPVAIFSLETSKEQLVLRMLCAEAKVDYHSIRTGYLRSEDWDRLTRAFGRLAESPVFIDDTPGISVLELRAKARMIKKEHDIGLIVIDYLQLMRGRGKVESRQQEISEISRSLKALARELNVPVIALSQLSRMVEHRNPPRPILADLRESGAIEQDADLVTFIYRPEAYRHLQLKEGEDGLAEIIIGKQRNGPIGSFKLAFLKHCTSFEDWTALDSPYETIPEGPFQISE